MSVSNPVSYDLHWLSLTVQDDFCLVQGERTLELETLTNHVEIVGLPLELDASTLVVMLNGSAGRPELHQVIHRKQSTASSLLLTIMSHGKGSCQVKVAFRVQGLKWHADYAWIVDAGKDSVTAGSADFPVKISAIATKGTVPSVSEAAARK